MERALKRRTLGSNRANRARNIKNRAEVWEKEDGWHNLRWLQGMVTKLRKEMNLLKEGGASVEENRTTPYGNKWRDAAEVPSR